MELSRAIRTGYIQALDGVISVPVFDAFAVPEDPGGSYVLVSSISSVQRIIKRCKAWDVSVVLDIVTRTADPSGMRTADGIAEEIENIINPDSQVDIDITNNGYRLGNTFRLGDNNITSKGDLYYLYRKLVTYSHIVSKVGT